MLLYNNKHKTYLYCMEVNTESITPLGIMTFSIPTLNILTLSKTMFSII
jgi:hypothetical protein